ncbi:MAG: phenylalanine--tRNA ligase subunit beta, partial [Clostridia bacterium]|nr:phenylalanine--tRNA ligase subunit beta [Clostridia bacterium]
RGVIDVFDGKVEDKVMKVTTDKINRVLGIKVPEEEMVSILNRLSLKTSLKEGLLTVSVPQYREDIVGANDLAEEIIRMYGYDNIVSTPLDGMHQTHGGLYERQKWINRIKTLLSGSLGGHEILSYSFVSPKSADLLGLPDDDPRRNVINILNPLGEEVSVMRTNLTHSMIKTVAFNLSHSNKEALLYEVGKIYLPDDKEPSREVETLCLATFGEGKDFYALKSALDMVASLLNVSFKYVAGSEPMLHPGRNADVLLSGRKIGYIGQLHPQCAARYKLDQRVIVAEIDLDALIAEAKDHLPYVPMPKYPSISRDLAFVIRNKVTGDEILDTIRAACDDKLEDLYIFDVYEGAGILTGNKSVAVTVVFRDPNRTLVDNEVVERVDKILAAMKEKWGAVLR